MQNKTALFAGLLQCSCLGFCGKAAIRTLLQLNEAMAETGSRANEYSGRHPNGLAERANEH